VAGGRLSPEWRNGPGRRPGPLRSRGWDGSGDVAADHEARADQGEHEPVDGGNQDPTHCERWSPPGLVIAAAAALGSHLVRLGAFSRLTSRPSTTTTQTSVPTSAAIWLRNSAPTPTPSRANSAAASRAPATTRPRSASRRDGVIPLTASHPVAT
jgi:hypothetical protein